MLNQISPISNEANSSGVFLKNYIEYVEDFPDDIMKLISICRELDVKTNNIVKEAESIAEKMTNATKEKKAKFSSRLQQILIKLQDFNDEKIHFGQILAEKIETKFRTVDRDYQNNLNSKPDRIQSPIPSSSAARKTSIEQQILSVLPLKRTSATGSNISSSSSSENASNDRNPKRMRRTRTDISEDVQIKIENINKSASLMSQASNVAKKAVAAANKKQKKTAAAKKAVVSKQSTQPIQEPIQGIHDDVDPDEETYCLCGQISYGEMILCENDLCGIEWFHFSCVSLQSKPKGKWYCPNCRGDRPNVMNKNLKKKFQDSPNNDRKFV